MSIEHIGIIEITDDLLRHTFPSFYPRLKESLKLGMCDDKALLKEVCTLLLLPSSYTAIYAEFGPVVVPVWHVQVKSVDIPPTDTEEPLAFFPRVTPTYEMVEGKPALHSISFSRHDYEDIPVPPLYSPDSKHDKDENPLKKLLADALYCDSEHHKQWYLWKIAEALQLDLSSEWDEEYPEPEKGIAP